MSLIVHGRQNQLTYWI